MRRPTQLNSRSSLHSSSREKLNSSRSCAWRRSARQFLPRSLRARRRLSCCCASRARLPRSISRPPTRLACLELAASGQPNLLAAVVEILEAEWNEVDIRANIPVRYMGTDRQRISEWGRAHPDPPLLLRDLGARTLRSHAERLGVGSQAPDADAAALAREVLVAIGFAVPQQA